MTGKQLTKSMAAVGLSLALLFTATAGGTPAGAVSLDSLQQKESALQKKEKQLDAQIAELKNDSTKQQQYKNAVDDKVIDIEQQIDGKNSQIAQLDIDIRQKEASIAGKQKEINTDFQELKQRVYAIYLTGEASHLEVVLNAKNVMDLADKTEVLRAVSEHDAKLMHNLKADMESVSAQKAVIESSRRAASTARTSLEQDQKQLDAISQESAKKIALLNQDQKNAEAQKSSNLNAQKKAEANVNQWLSNYFANQKKSAGLTSMPGNVPASGRAATVISQAEQYLGFPYVWGGSTPQTSFDCSGYVSWVLNHSGWNLGRRGVDGLYSACTPVSASAAQPGDLVFYNYTYGGLPRSHVGIYVGNGQAIQCDDPGVEIVNLSSSYWKSHFDSFGRPN